MVKKLQKMAEKKAHNPAGLLDNPMAKLVKDSAQQIWLAGMGAFGRAQEEGTKLFEGLVKEGMGLEQTMRKFAGGRAEDLGTDQDRRRNDGDDARPDDLAGGGRGGLRAHHLVLCAGRNLSEKAASYKRKMRKNAASRDIDCRMFQSVFA